MRFSSFYKKSIAILLSIISTVMCQFLPVNLAYAANACTQLFNTSDSTLETAKKMIAAGQTEDGTERNKLFVESPHYIRVRVGMPATLELVSAERKVFRHYVSEERLQEILRTKTLQAGWTPFYYSGYITDYNEDLTGIFITTPEFKPDQVGVRPEHKSFIDFKLPSNTGILFLRDGVLLIPGTPSVEPWKLQLYQSENRKWYPEYTEEFAKWDRAGIPQPLEVSVEIIGHSK